MFVVLSFIISIILGVIINSIVYNTFGIGKKSDKEIYEYIHEYEMNDLTKDLRKVKYSDEAKMKKLVNEYWSDNFLVYMVNQNGDVLASTNRAVKSIDTIYIKDGFREIVYNKNSQNGIFSNSIKYYARIRGCNYITNDYYLYFDYNGNVQDDSKSLIYMLILFPIIFILMMSGRIGYIIKINKSIRTIADGDLTHRTSLKYKNELRQLAEDVNYMASELQSEDENRKEFLTNISHDLRTPLTIIMGYINMIKEKKYENEEELDEYVQIMEKKSQFLKGMLDDFFQYSKLSSMDLELNIENIYLQELIRQIVEEECSVFKDKDLELSLTLTEKTINIQGDGEFLYRAVDNLLSNALKYSKKGTTVEVALEKKVIEKISYGIISVSNIPRNEVNSEETQRFFERLYKQDKSRKQEGTQDGSGLGLSIVKEIIKLHHGIARVKKEGERIRFELLIPNL